MVRWWNLLIFQFRGQRLTSWENIWMYKDATQLYVCLILNKFSFILISENESPGESSITEVKLTIKGSTDQAISQVIVFSMLQKIKHPSFDRHLVPSIVISSDEFYIVMFDAAKEILLCTPICDIFQDKSKSVVYEEVVLILWMILHHRILCSGIPERQDLIAAQSGFRQRASEAWEIYTANLKGLVSNFPQVTTENMECTVLQYFDKAKFNSGEEVWVGLGIVVSIAM